MNSPRSIQHLRKNRFNLCWPQILALLGILAVTCGTLEAELLSGKKADRKITPAAWLKQQPKPFFKPEWTLPRLTRYGGGMPLDTRVELAENWGFAMELSSYLDDHGLSLLEDRESDNSKAVALAKSNPKRYPLSVICSRKMPGTEAPPETWTHDKHGKVINGQAHSMDGTVWSEEHGAIYSPEAPDSVWKMAGEYRAAPLRELKKRGIPISIILNGGEYGLSVPGFARPAWSLDPKVAAAVANFPGGSWQDYASAKKGNSEQIIADAVRAAVPDRNYYIYYTAGGGTLRNKDATIGDWGPQWKDLRHVSDLPSNELYYKHFNDGFTGRLNMLTLALNAVAAEISACAPLSNVGFYGSPPAGGYNTPFPADSPPIWLTQMATSSYIHALFSHLESIIRQSDLLPGTMKNGVSTADPAYEMTTGDANVRVLARKNKTQPEWILAAWAAEGDNRNVEVEVPELGKVTLRARICGSVYRAVLKDGKLSLRLMDEEGELFTRAPANNSTVQAVNE